MKTKTYEDFDLSIEKVGDHYRARVLSSPDGPAPATEFEMPFSELELENFILRFGQKDGERLERFPPTVVAGANRLFRDVQNQAGWLAQFGSTKTAYVFEVL
jgi:hypothetical protein